MDPSALTTIRYEAADGVATITLDRADRHNAFTSAMCDEMAATWAHVREDDDVRAIVVTGAGEKAFCTGIDRDEVPAEDGVEYTFDPLTYHDPGGAARASKQRVLEAGGRGDQRDGVRRRVLPARRGRHPRGGRPRHVLRSARHLRDAGGVRAGADAAPHAVRRGHADDAPGQPRADQRRARPRDRPRHRGGAAGRAGRPPPSASRPPSRHSRPTAVQASLRSLWAARELTRAPDARRRQHVPEPGDEQGRARRGAGRVHAPASASTPRSGDPRGHRPRGGPALRTPAGVRRPRRLGRVLRRARPALRRGRRRAAGRGHRPGRRGAAAAAVRLGLRRRVRGRRQGGRHHGRA